MVKEERIKLKQNYWALAGIIIVAILLVIVILEIKKREQANIMNGVECFQDSDCVKQATSCCPCSMGGNEICVSKQNASIIQKSLGACGDMMCLAVYNCKETRCLCREGKCVEK